MALLSSLYRMKEENQSQARELVQQALHTCSALWACQGICDWDRWHLSWPLLWATLPWRTTVSNKAQLPSDLGEGGIVGCGNGCVETLRISHMPCTATKGESYVLSYKADQKGRFHWHFSCLGPQCVTLPLT